MPALARVLNAPPEKWFDALFSRLPGEPGPVRARLTLLAGRWSRSVAVDKTARSAAISRDPRGPDSVARLATRGAWGIQDISTGIANGDTRCLEAASPRNLLSLAWLLYVQHRGGSDYRDAAAIFKYTTRSLDFVHWDTRFALACIGALLAIRDYEEASRLTELLPAGIEREMLRLDSAAAGDVPDPTALASLWESRGHSAVGLRPGEEPAFDRLTSAARERAVAGTLVSVVISSYRPGPELLTAVKSVLAQSWHNLEILVVDDASGPRYREIYDAVIALDSRVRLHRMKVNGGTYAIRNWALDNAQGEYITFHDADDWMHPERIALQAAHLGEHPGVMKNATMGTRVTESLAFSHTRKLGANISEPSLMFRRAETVALVGYYDAVRRGADSEYRLRLERASASPTPILGSAPLTLERLTTASLSSGNIIGHWFSPSRRVYRSCFEGWHERVDNLRLTPQDGRPFYAPAPMIGSDQPRVDVVVVSNWLEQGTWNRDCPAAWRIVQLLLRRGVRVGIAQESALMPLARMRASLSHATSGLLNSGAIEFIDLQRLPQEDPPLLVAPHGGSAAQKGESFSHVLAFVPGKARGASAVAAEALLLLRSSQ